MQLLWINLVTDGLPGIALGMERASKSVMNQPPNPKGRLIDAKQWVGIVAMGVCFAISTLIGYAVGNKISANAASTMAFLVLATSQLFYSLLVASNYKPFTNGVAPFTAISFVVSLFLVVVVCFVSPLANLMMLAALPTRCYLIALALSVAPSVVSLVAVLLASKVSFYKK
jgi:Ca2+-transporting ATPase